MLHQLSSPVAMVCPMQISVFDRAAEMFCGDACKMTRLLGSKTCSEVHARLQVRHPELLKMAQAGMLGSRPAARCMPGSQARCGLQLQTAGCLQRFAVPSQLAAGLIGPSHPALLHEEHHA